jgi:putative Mn2+ efflux pump MntP
MGILVIYIGIILVGDSIAVGIGEAIDRLSPTFSLPIFLAMFFGVFYFGWHLALRLTEPREQKQK